MKVLSLTFLGMVLCLSILFVFGACDADDDDDTSNNDDNADNDDNDDDDDDDDDDGNDDDDDNDIAPFKVIADYVAIDAPAPPPNPVTGAQTPPKYNQVLVYRFRQDTGDDPPRPVKGIILLTTGWGAGANQFSLVAHDLVELSQGDVEVWIEDRRSNFLEDQWGFDVAEAQKDPQLAWDYYYNSIPVQGKIFEGWRDPFSPDLEMMSEWGADLEMKTLNAIIQQIPEQNRQTNVFLGGHSQGTRTTKMYASYEFPDGHLGYEDLAGLILYDGKDGALEYEVTEQEYLDALEGIRQGTLPYYLSQTYGAGVSILGQMQYFGMVVSQDFSLDNPEYGPDGFQSQWPLVINLFLKVMTRFNNVVMTNQAVAGLFLDDQSSFLGDVFTVHAGRLIGGTIGHDDGGDFPNENQAVYSWADYDQTDPEELVDLQRLARMLYEGPTDFTDTYNSHRLVQEHVFAGIFESSGTWLHNYFHFYSSSVDIPVICVESDYAEGYGVYEDYRDLIAPIRGQDQPRTEVGFEIIPVHDWSHMEVLLVQPDRNPLYTGILKWVDKWTVGQVQVPRFGSVPAF